jgi:TolB-like protein/tetratricopeptide (TPR) repeat protein
MLQRKEGTMKKLPFLITFTFLLFFFLFPTPCLAKQINILVHPFENTGDKAYSWLSAGMTETVITDLMRIQNISVVSNQDRKKILEEMKFIFSGLVEEDKMIKLGKLTGANVIFTGSYLVSGDRIRVHARLVNVETGKVESSTKIDGTLNGIFDLQDKVVFTLMGETEKITIADSKPAKFTEQDKKKIEEKPRPSVTAYERYAKGLEIQYTNPKDALVNFKKALDIDPNYTDALREAGHTAGNTLNLFSEALGYLEKAERIFKGRNETKSSDYADLIMRIGIIYQSKGQYDRALEYYLNSQSICYRLGLQNTAGYAILMNNIGIIYQSKGQYDRVLEYYLNSQSIRDRLGLQNTADYASLTNNIGTVYAIKGQHDRALEYYLNSQSICYRLGLQNTASYASLMNNMGLVYVSKGQFDRALEYYLNSQSIRDRLGLQNTADYASLMNNMALLYEKQGQLDIAGRHYRMAYDTYGRSGYSAKLRDKALNDAKRLGH